MLFVSADHPLWVARDGLGPCTSMLLMVLGQSWLLAAPSCSEPLAQLGFSLFFFQIFPFFFILSECCSVPCRWGWCLSLQKLGARLAARSSPPRGRWREDTAGGRAGEGGRGLK